MSEFTNPRVYPALVRVTSDGHRTTEYHGNAGLQLRDLIAKEALNHTLPASLSAADRKGFSSQVAAQTAAVMAYEVADAMLAARATQGDA